MSHILLIIFICPFFLLSNNFSHHISSDYLRPGVFYTNRTYTIQFVYTLTKCNTENKTKVLRFNLPSFFLFSPSTISHPSVIYRDIFVKDFTRNKEPRISKFCTNVGYKRISYFLHIILFIFSYFCLSNKICCHRFCERSGRQTWVLVTWINDMEHTNEKLIHNLHLMQKN